MTDIPQWAAQRACDLANAEVRALGNGADPSLTALARLIASAPDLLSALEEAVSQYGQPGGPWNVPSDPGGWLDRAKAAIRKARGQEVGV